MKENKYDNSVFFKKYSEMPRSKYGLSAAGEWEVLERVLPQLKDKSILDLGCGYGWHCKYAANKGASKIVGVDISTKMLELANLKNSAWNISYSCMAMEDIEFQEESFDIVFSSLAIHYIKDFDFLVRKIYKILKKGGSFIFSVEHPVFTAHGSQNWIFNEDGEINHFPVDNYYYEGKRETNFLGEVVTKYHRTLTTYLSVLLSNNFKIKNVVEPMPSEDLLNSVPGMKDELRRPMMLIISVEK
ncbi:class I SAM-dependent methyltransferase [Cetobacterium somerae]